VLELVLDAALLVPDPPVLTPPPVPPPHAHAPNWLAAPHV
jgi:hypothetical protein